MGTLATAHELLGRTRNRLRKFAPSRGLAQRSFYRGLLFGAVVLAVSLVGRAWAKVRLPESPVTVAVPIDGVPHSVEAPLPSPALAREANASSVPVVSLTASTTQAPSAEMPDARIVDLNKTSAAELETLPYVGPKRAEAILALRAKVGRFRNVEDLLKVKGIGRGTLKRMRSRLTVGA
jgi:competence protein ComEA